MRLVRRDPSVGYLDNNLSVPKSAINLQGVKAALTFALADSRTLRVLALYKETPDHLSVPRDFWQVKDLPFPVVDCRPMSFSQANIKSRITLDVKHPGETVQQEAVAAMQAARGGVLQLACGRGKTVCALELAAREKVPTLIVVDNTHLLGQWKEEIEKHLILEEPIGMIGDGAFDWKRPVVLATYQTLAKKAANFTEEVRRWFGLIIADEAHHLSAPTWASIADLFYGKRIGLTATPTRVDGSHVIFDFHLGPVLYKDLTQDLKPSIFFFWTGLEIDTTDSAVKKLTCDVNGEVHNSMLASYFGQWRDRLDLILTEVKTAERLGRKVLVLSYSIDELVNMFCIWSGQPLYTSVTYPTPQDVGENVLPVELDEKMLKRCQERLHTIRAMEKLHATDNKALYNLKIQKDEINARLHAHAVWKKCDLEYQRRQLAFLRQVLQDNKSNAGLMIGAVKPVERQKMLRSKQIVFAIMKYGREGLDEPSLDTIFVCEPMSQKNGLQQLMGRALRKKAGKRTPVVLFFEDNIGPMIGMCSALRKHLREWPLEEGGPFTYELVHHARKGAKQTWATL